MRAVPFRMQIGIGKHFGLYLSANELLVRLRRWPRCQARMALNKKEDLRCLVDKVTTTIWFHRASTAYISAEALKSACSTDTSDAYFRETFHCCGYTATASEDTALCSATLQRRYFISNKLYSGIETIPFETFRSSQDFQVNKIGRKRRKNFCRHVSTATSKD